MENENNGNDSKKDSNVDNNEERKGQYDKDAREKKTRTETVVHKMEIDYVALIDSTYQINEEMQSTIVPEADKDDNKETDNEIDTYDKRETENEKVMDTVADVM